MNAKHFPFNYARRNEEGGGRATRNPGASKAAMQKAERLSYHHRIMSDGVGGPRVTVIMPPEPCGL